MPKRSGDKAPVKRLTELRTWNVAHARGGAMKSGLANLDAAEEMDVRADRADIAACPAGFEPKPAPFNVT